MKVFTNNKFEGYYPVGAAAVIVAEDKQDAAIQLSNALFDVGLPCDVAIENMIEINTEEKQAVILCDGNY